MTCEVLFFTAPWCDPCRQAAPIFSEVVAELGVTARFVDVDLDPDLADRVGVDMLPTVAIRTDGTVSGTLTGSRPKAELRSFIQDSLPKVSKTGGSDVAK
ncbi:MAG: thioredoxin family protein [Flaviflexus sp.]|uniref:thioredoxin family protein n=1 Tax=Flaviflexus sp. TaxID=1969482 RepID=UPI003F927FE2